MSRCLPERRWNSTFAPITHRPFIGARRSVLSLHAKTLRDQYRNTSQFAGSIRRSYVETYGELTVPELRRLAKIKGVRGYSKMKKPQLVEALS